MQRKRIESQAMSFKNKINAYTCPAGHQTITVDRDEGMTTFMLGCKHPGCTLHAQSSFYRCPQDLTPEWEWYRPNEDELSRTDAMMVEHARAGGLFIRRIGPEAGGFPTGKQLTRMGGKWSPKSAA